MKKELKDQRLFVRVSRSDKTYIQKFKNEHHIGLLELILLGIDSIKKESCK